MCLVYFKTFSFVCLYKPKKVIIFVLSFIVLYILVFTFKNIEVFANLLNQI